MARRKRAKKVFPAQYNATRVSVPRIDAVKAAAYNQQRSRPTAGPRSDISHKPESNFMQEIPRTRGLSTHEPNLVDGKTGEKFSKSNLPKRSSFFRYKTPPKLAVEHKHQLIVMEQKRKEGCFLRYFKVWQSTWKQGITEYHCQVLMQKGSVSRKLYFSGNEALIVQESATHYSISKTYQGLDVALYHYNNNRISWDSREEKKPDTSST